MAILPNLMAATSKSVFDNHLNISLSVNIKVECMGCLIANVTFSHYLCSMAVG